MGRVVFLAIALVAMVAAYATAFLPARAEQPLKPACIASQPQNLAISDVTDPNVRWQCREFSRSAVTPNTLWLFDLAGGAKPHARFLRSRIGLFQSIDMAVLDKDGTMRRSSVTQSDARTISGEPLFLVELPEITPQSSALYVKFNGSQHNATVIHAEVFEADPSRNMPHYHNMLFLALLLGMMVMPVLFDLAFWGALRSSFLLWHAALSLSLGGLVFLRSGLVVEFIDLSIEQWRTLLIMSLGTSTLMAALFTISFIEEGRLGHGLRRAMFVAGIWAFLASAIHATGFDFLRPLGGAFHTYALAPVLAVFIGVMADAYRRGSRSIRFQIIGWIPLLLAFSVQVFTYLVPMGLPTDALPLFYIGVLSETAVTAVGVADRFFVIRRERDQARTEAIALEQLSERDPLTGLHNRRAIDSRFEELHKAGYETFALIDLDHFKPVNDTAGHIVGDEVLKVVARVIDSDKQSIAMRLGGEEFLLVMRGEDTIERAEKLRNAIPIRVAQEVPELEQLVTASMGLVTAPHSAMPMAGFSDIYSRADMLLYEAKAQGRNRMVSERLQAFERRDRRAEDRRKTRAA